MQPDKVVSVSVVLVGLETLQDLAERHMVRRQLNVQGAEVLTEVGVEPRELVEVLLLLDLMEETLAHPHRVGGAAVGLSGLEGGGGLEPQPSHTR